MRQEMSELLKKYPTPGHFLKDKFKINNVMEFDFPNVDSMNQGNLHYDRIKEIRGGVAMTNEESERLIEEAVNIKL
jgi:hypothetical protein